MDSFEGGRSFSELERRATGDVETGYQEAWASYLEIFHCLNYTGMRISDAIALKWEDISLRFSTIKFQQKKTEKDALIRIPSAYRDRLRALIPPDQPQSGETMTGPVYKNSSGNAFTYSPLDRAIRVVLKACGIKKKSPIHSFRHTVAMRLLRNGLPVHIVANQLGDTVDTVVRVYVKPEVPSLEMIDQAFGQKSENSSNENQNLHIVTSENAD